MKRLLIALLPLICAATAWSATTDNETTPDTTSMLGKGVNLSDVVVYGSKAAFGVQESQMSAISVGKQQILAVPVFFGEPDVMKTLQKLPGVQSTNDGTAGILVRGGNYDQNLITLDGSTLYNGEHLKGFVSAINPDVVGNINFYRGAFPARYGSRLSSVIDIGVKTGDFNRCHGNISLAMLASRIQIDGPIWKGHTSLNIAARVSYFDMVAYPTLERYYDKPDWMKPFSDMDFYDINAKIVHRFSPASRLSAVFYYGKDWVKTEPTKNVVFNTTFYLDKIKDEDKIEHDNRRENSSRNNWGNIVSSIYWTYQPSDAWWMNLNLSYSRYKYLLTQNSYLKSSVRNYMKYEYFFEETSKITHHSEIDDIALTFDSKYTRFDNHLLRFGGKVSLQRLNPTQDVTKHSFGKRINLEKYPNYRFLPFYKEKEFIDYWLEKTIDIDTVFGKSTNIYHASLYAEDDYTITSQLKANIGLRLSLYSTTGKSYFSAEPRVSLRWLFRDDMALKFSYSRMSQAVRLLQNNNLVMPSDTWVPITDRVPLMYSDLVALGYNYEIMRGFNLSVEGYYKTMSNVLEYRMGSTYTSGSGDWQDMTAIGDGRSYGAEFLLEKKHGKTTGWISYTWSKSLRTFDRPGNLINAGFEYYAGNDHRNNLNVVIMQHVPLSRVCYFDFSASWSYITGRCGIVPDINIYGGMPDEYDPFGNILDGSGYFGTIDRPSTSTGWTQNPMGGQYFSKLIQLFTFKGVNQYKLPDIHHLDLGISFGVKHDYGESIFGVSVYNAYNRLNVSSVNIGYDSHYKKTMLKGICYFPIMPSVNYTHKF